MVLFQEQLLGSTRLYSTGLDSVFRVAREWRHWMSHESDSFTRIKPARDEKVYQEVSELMAAHGYQRILKQCPEELKKKTRFSLFIIYLCFKLWTNLLWKIHYYKTPFTWQTIQLKNHVSKLIQQSMNLDGEHLFVELHEVVTQRFPRLSPRCQLVIQFAVWLSLVVPRAAHCALTFPQPSSQEMRTERGQKQCLSAFGLYRQFPRSHVLWLQGRRRQVTTVVWLAVAK